MPADSPLEDIDALSSKITGGKSPDELREALPHLERIKAYFGVYHSGDKYTQELVRKVDDGVHKFIRDVEEGAPSPYIGFAPSLSALRSRIYPGFKENGWPK